MESPFASQCSRTHLRSPGVPPPPFHHRLQSSAPGGDGAQRPLVTGSLAGSQVAGLCLCKIQMGKNRSLLVFMATLSLRGDLSLPITSSRGNSQNKAPCFAFAEKKKNPHRSPRAQTCDAEKSIFYLTMGGGVFTCKRQVKEPVRSRAGVRRGELTDNFSLFPDSASTLGRQLCSISGAGSSFGPGTSQPNREMVLLRQDCGEGRGSRSGNNH